MLAISVFSMAHNNEKLPFDIMHHGAIVQLVNFSSQPLLLTHT